MSYVFIEDRVVHFLEECLGVLVRGIRCAQHSLLVVRREEGNIIPIKSLYDILDSFIPY